MSSLTAANAAACSGGQVCLSAEGLVRYERLQAMPIDTKGPYPLSRRLAKESDWPYPYTLQIIGEYKKLITLITEVGDELVAPADVEEAWRLHLIYTVSYFKDMCNGVLGRRIEHECDDGSIRPAEMSRRFQRTLDAYRSAFGEPPAGIWVEPDWQGLSLRESVAWRARLFQRRIKRAMMQRRTVRMVQNLASWTPDDHKAIWRALDTFQFDKPGVPYPYSLRLADESFDGDREHALDAINEYRKFLALLRFTGHWVTPSLDVDEAWHLHMGNTRSYWVDLAKVLGRPYDHFPGDGTAEDERKFQAIYQRTLDDYARYFGAPPTHIWGRRDTSIDWESVLKGTGF